MRARVVVGADGALSAVARQEVPAAKRARHVFAYHEIVEAPAPGTEPRYDACRCDVYYQGRLSPDFYAWVFPHGGQCSVGTGTFEQGFDMRGAVATLREVVGLAGVRTLKREGAPIPCAPLRRWDNGRDVVLAGDAAGLHAFAVAVGTVLGEAYAPVVERRRGEAYGAAERALQCERRGRYAEFNLLHDRGTLFGLQTGARVDSVLMSLPPAAAWPAPGPHAPGSLGARLGAMLVPRDWLAVGAGWR